MKFLIRGKCLALALRLINEGHQVKLADPYSKDVGKDIVELTPYDDAAVRWADIVIFDINDGGLPDEAEALRGRKKPVIGSSKFAGTLENDRKIGANIAFSAGIKTNVIYEFSGPAAFDKAKAFLDSNRSKTGWVWKSNDSSPDDPPTYVGKEVDLFFRMMVHYENLYKTAKRPPDFILTPIIEGAEVSTEGWFNGRQFFLGNHTVEKNREYNGDLGPKTGCSGCVVWSANNSALYQKLIPSLTKAFAGKYIGPVDVNAIIESETNEPVFLEFTPRLGYDAIYAFLELLNGDLAELLSDLCTGRLPRNTLIDNAKAATLRLYIPPYPESTKTVGEAQGVPIAGFDVEKYNKHISPCDVALDENGDLVAATDSGQLFSLSNTGEKILAIYDTLYKMAETLEIPQVGYRTDLAECTQEAYDRLAKTKWLGEASKIKQEPKTFGELLANGRYK